MMQKIIMTSIISIFILNVFAISDIDLAKEIILTNQSRLMRSNRIDVTKKIDFKAIFHKNIVDFFSKINSFHEYGDATILPFFSENDEYIKISSDKKIIEVKVISSNENINNYYKDIAVFVDIQNKKILKIKSITFIYVHKPNKKKTISFTENCLAKFKEINGYCLPVEIRYFSNKFDNSIPNLYRKVFSQSDELNPRQLVQLTYSFTDLSRDDTLQKISKSIQLLETLELNEYAYPLLGNYWKKSYSSTFWKKQIEESKLYYYPNIPDSVWTFVEKEINEDNTLFLNMCEIVADAFEQAELDELNLLLKNKATVDSLKMRNILTHHRSSSRRNSDRYFDGKSDVLKNLFENKTLQKFYEFQDSSNPTIGGRAMILEIELQKKISTYLRSHNYIDKLQLEVN